MKFVEKLTKGKRKLIFFDLEGTQTSCEIIAIAAIKVELDAKYNIKKIDKKGFKVYVKSKDKIGPVVIKLTGITEDILKKQGVSFNIAIDGLKKYIGKNHKDYTYLTYGNYDKKLLFETCNLNESYAIDFIKDIAINHVDFASFLSKYMKDENNNSYSLVESIKVLGGTPLGKKHDPFDDTRNLIQLYELVIKNIPILKEQYKKLIYQNPKVEEPVFKVIKKLQNNENVTPKDFEHFVDEYFK